MVQQLSVVTSDTLVPFPLKARTADVRGAAAILTMASVSEQPPPSTGFGLPTGSQASSTTVGSIRS